MKYANGHVSFVAVPFLPTHQPALGVSSLSAVLHRRGIPADVTYLNVAYENDIGSALNTLISEKMPYQLLLGDFIFTPALWGDAAVDWNGYRSRLRTWNETEGRAKVADIEDLLDKIHFLHVRSVDIVKSWARMLVDKAPSIIGLTSTFQQNVASLALAQEIRRLVPRSEIAILMGGANCDGEMGRALSENFPFIDHVVSGEAENVIVETVEGVLADQTNRAVAASIPRVVLGSVVTDMDGLPLPHFDDFFVAVRGTQWENKANLVAESSRGCWWGAKSHCTFCGLNGSTMSFRRKGGLRFADELRSLSRKYGPDFFMPTDNIIDMKYLNTLLPELASGDEQIGLFYETKSNLRKDQLEMMAAGGIVRLQPGIESLSTPILKLMGKGTTRLQNIQLLKWARELDIAVTWNFLFGFPGEQEVEYDAMAALIPALVHLPAPTGFGAIRIDRFSPYWRTPEAYGLENMKSYWAYGFVYSNLEPAERERIAYCFDADYADKRDPWRYARPAIAEIEEWREAVSREASLCFEKEKDEVSIRDTRGGLDVVERISGSDYALLTALDERASLSKLTLMMEAGRFGVGVRLPQLLETLTTFKDKHWVIEEDGQFLSLIINPFAREKVIDIRVTLRLERLGLGPAGSHDHALKAV
jgi:ribosomal peptide maturation radical SAM protein 1